MLFHLFVDMPDRQAAIIEYLDEMILGYPDVEMRVRYKLPFYYRKRWVCYLNPQKNGAVELAFIRGNELGDHAGLLSSRGRKQVYGFLVDDLCSLPEEAIHELLQEAFLLDEAIPYSPKHKRS